MACMQTVVTAARLLSPGVDLTNPVLVVEDGVIATIGTAESMETPAAAARSLNFPGMTLVPSFFDVHIHGAAGHDVMEATPAALAGMGTFLASRGVGSYLATTVTAPVDKILHALDSLATLIEAPRFITTLAGSALGSEQATQQGTACALPVGIHLEGPFLSHAKRGIHPPDQLLNPTLELLERMVQAARGHIRLITVAPELPGAVEFLERAQQLGIATSMGHSNATLAEAQRGVKAGAVSATHTFNAMRALDHREPGILGLALTCDQLYAELIADGVHVHPDMVRLWWRSKPAGKHILITDAMSATGMPDGHYLLGGIAAEVSGGIATHNGALAGSLLTLDLALRNCMGFTGATLPQVLPAVGLNQAHMLTGPNQTSSLTGTGGLAPGSPANITVLTPAHTVHAIFLASTTGLS